MKTVLVGAVTIFCLFSDCRALAAETSLEAQVLAALNSARTDPQNYARGLQRYRTYFDGDLIRYPGQAADLQTEEGVAAVDEAIAFTGRQPALAPVDGAPLLAASAADLAADQASGGIGHSGSDGSSPADRARRHGGGGYVAEVIAYGPVDAADVVRQLIIDDGVPDRGHRSILYSPELRFAGVACGHHPEYRVVCVIDLGIRSDGRPATR